MWFEKLVGFTEDNPEQVRQNIEIRANILKSKVNGAEYNFGRLEVPTLEELQKLAPSLDNYNSKIQVSEVVGDVQMLHKDPSNNVALFQAASQFNLLEMVRPGITPEKGVESYEDDLTQGPACAVACGAGTIYRNYFANVNGEVGQSSDNQIDCLKDIGVELGNKESSLWEMKNGYALANIEGLNYITNKINKLSIQEYENLKSKLRVGIQWNTEVTLDNNSKNLITQVYCSALPVRYSYISSVHWTAFARLILEATYEATFYAALMNYNQNGNNKVFLTLVGGGAFGNRSEWIIDAIRKSIIKFSNTPLDIRIVSYENSKLEVRELVRLIK